MAIGKVNGIFIASNFGDDTISVEQVTLIPGKGIEGDRYFGKLAKPGQEKKPGRELTLIQSEVLQLIREQAGIDITPAETRRNILTKGISLNDLVGQDFSIGEVQLHGVRLCEPCQYLADRTDPRLLTALVHRGGLRADILTAGTIHVNDLIHAFEKE